MKNPMFITAYLAGEIHSDWRDQLANECKKRNLLVEFSGPILDHAASDRASQNILGEDDDPFCRDLKSARVNAIRTHALIRESEIVIVRFGEQYKQWNAAFDAGFAAALNKPIITLHDDELTHALKEVNAAAYASARTPEQVAKLLQYCYPEILDASGDYQ